MLTVRKTLESVLDAHGLFEADQQAIVSHLINNADNSLKGINWDDPTDGYPKHVIDHLTGTVKRHAAEWLTERQPAHFAIALLEA